MKIAVTINTYYRDERTHSLLTRALNSVYSQSHQDFKIFLIGDKYSNTDSWNSIINHFYTQGKLYYENLAEAVERDKYEKMILWCCGGCNALQIANKKALDEGFDYIAHLDHDDYWDANHLFEINKYIEKTKADWICTKSTYGMFNILPKIDSYESYTHFLPVGGGLIHSSACYNHRTIPLQVRNAYVEDGLIIPSDADLWDRIQEHMKYAKLKGICINRVTCHHDEEGATYAN